MLQRGRDPARGRWNPATGMVLCAASCLALAVGPATVQAAERSFELTVAAGRLAAGPALVRVRQGDDVELRWTADAALTVHLHGYDITLELEPGVPAALRFSAQVAGRFAVEAHTPSGRHARLLHVEVHPR